MEKLTVKKLTDEFERYQDAKYSKNGNVEARVLEAICAAEGEHWTAVRNGVLRYTHESSGVKVPFNFIGKYKEKLKGRLSAIAPVFKASPDTADPADSDQAKVVDKLIVALDQKLGQESITSEIIDRLLDEGICIEHIPWVPDMTREPMPVRVEDRPELAAQFPNVPPDDLLFENLADPEGGIVPQSYVDYALQQGAMPESFQPLEELRDEGDVGSELHGALTFFTDPSVVDIHKMSPDQSIMFAYVKDRSWIEENFDEKDFKKLNPSLENGFDSLNADENIKIVKTNLARVGSSLNGTNIENLLPALQGSRGPKDPDMFMVIYRYQDRSKKNPEGRCTIFIPNQAKLKDGENTYEDGIPAVVYHWEPPTKTIFTKGWVTDLIPANKTYDRVVSDIVDYMKKFSKAPVLGGHGVTQEDWGKGDVSRFVKDGLTVEGNPKFKYMEIAQMPVVMSQLVETLKMSLDDLAGGTDLFQEKKFPGQLRGSQGVAWLQEILDSQYGPIFTHLGERLAQAKQKRINRVKQFYPPLRTLHYVARNDRVEVFEFHKSEVLEGNVEYNITIERGSLIPELRAMREARIRERLEGPLSIMYIDERTGAFDKGKIAADLQMGDSSREARESRARKLARDIIERLRQGKPVLPPKPFMDPVPMLDEFEDVMNDMDFLEGSEQMQMAVFQYWQQLQQMAAQAAQQQQQAMMSQLQMGATAQAVQQVTAQMSADVIETAKDAINTSIQGFVQQITSNPQFLQNLVMSAAQQHGGVQQ